MYTTHEKLGVYPSFPEETTGEPAPCPPAFLEYTWYVTLAYSMLDQSWGVHIPMIGGMMFAILAAACLFSIGGQATRLYTPVALVLWTTVSVIAIQIYFHSEQSLNNTYPYIGWLFNVIIAQALALRPGFLHRFAWAAFAIGLCVLPFVKVGIGGGLIRAGASGTGIASANALGMWFGFCTVYFLSWGLQSRNLWQRAVSWAVALGCLGIVLLSLSRGPLLGIFLACVVGFLPASKRYFFSMLSLIFLIWLVYVSELFQPMIDGFFLRGMEETGRGKVWPVALDRLLDSLWTGVGMDAISTQSAWNRYITPHNVLLYIGLGAGIIPLICFLGYLARVGTGILRIVRGVYVGETALLPSLVTFAFLEIMQLDTAFMMSWVVVVFALATMKRPLVRET